MKLGFWQKTYLDHLRAGYRKAYGAACIVDAKGNCSYCALGLMAEIAYQNGFVDCVSCGANFLYKEEGEDEDEDENIPEKIADLFGLRRKMKDFAVNSPRSGILYRGEFYNSLIALNDFSNISFNELADLIEENPSAFFYKTA